MKRCIAFFLITTLFVSTIMFSTVSAERDYAAEAGGFTNVLRTMAGSVVLLPGSPTAYVYGMRQRIQPPTINSGSVYISSEFFESAFGCEAPAEPTVNLTAEAGRLGKTLYSYENGLVTVSGNGKLEENLSEILQLVQAPVAVPSDMVLLEAENFSNTGGWRIDQQFMDIMGSPYLLAHGLGVPVTDAGTEVSFPKAGVYNVWVRTKNWTKPFGSDDAPGKFQLEVGGKTLSTVFGTVDSKDWEWQNGGTVEIPGTSTSVNLHDMTGFEGRCDAVLFTTDSNFTPPDGLALRAFRESIKKDTRDAGEYDLVVVGGGVAGTTTAISAARMGLSVALIQDRPVLGGNTSSEVRVQVEGRMNFWPNSYIGDITKEVNPTVRAGNGNANGALYQDERKFNAVINEGVYLYLNYHANEVQTDGNGQIVAVSAENITTGIRLKLKGTLFADCTGDGTIGFIAGADYEITNKNTTPEGGIYNTMGSSNLWNTRTDAAQTFPDVSSWAYRFNKVGPGPASWQWESGYNYNIIGDAEFIRDTNLRAAYGYVHFVRNISKTQPNTVLAWQAYISGKRESRRLLGDVVVTRSHIKNGNALLFDDSAFPATWSIDLHWPNMDYNEVIDGVDNPVIGETSQDNNKPNPFWFPYRSLYSRNINNLFMAGRNISVTHEALGTIRVMNTTGMMGEIVGIAAQMCKTYNALPRDIYNEHLTELKYKMAVGVTNDPNATPAPSPAPDEKYADKSQSIKFIYDSENQKVSYSDVTYSAEIRMSEVEGAGSASGIAYKVQENTGSYYLYRIAVDNNGKYVLQFYKFVNGTASKIWEKDLPPYISQDKFLRDFHNLTVNTKGNVTHFLFDGYYIDSYTDTNSPFLSGNFGIRNYAAGCTYRSVKFIDNSDNTNNYYSGISGFYNVSNAFVAGLKPTVRVKSLITNTGTQKNGSIIACLYKLKYGKLTLEKISLKKIMIPANSSAVYDADLEIPKDLIDTNADYVVKGFIWDSDDKISPLSECVEQSFKGNTYDQTPQPTAPPGTAAFSAGYNELRHFEDNVNYPYPTTDKNDWKAANSFYLVRADAGTPLNYYISFKFDVPEGKAGTYDFATRISPTSNRGVFAVEIDGASVGNINMKTATPQSDKGLSNIAGKVTLTEGEHTVKFTEQSNLQDGNRLFCLFSLEFLTVAD